MSSAGYIISECIGLVKTSGGVQTIAKWLKAKGYNVKTTTKRFPGFEFDIILVFDSAKTPPSAVEKDIKSVKGVLQIAIIPVIPA